MQYKKPRQHIESTNSAQIIRRLKSLGWVVARITPGKYGTAGVPDIYAAHAKHGARWIETKAPGGKLRSSQKKFFSGLAQEKIGVWVMLTEDDYPCLMGLPNWHKYI